MLRLHTSLDKKRTLFSFISLANIALLSVIFFIELFNSTVLSDFWFSQFENYHSSMAALQRMQLWKFHLISGVLICTLYGFYIIVFNRKNPIFITCLLLAIFSGLTLMVAQSKHLLALHIFATIISVVFYFMDSTEFILKDSNES